MPNKTITISANYYNITVINGDNTVLDNVSTVDIYGHTAISSFVVDTDLQTIIRIKPHKYYGATVIPYLRYYFSVEYELAVEEFEQIDAYTYELTTNFSTVTPANFNNIKLTIRCGMSMMYAYVRMKLTECTCNVQGGYALPVETTFTLTCDSGHEFQITPQIDYGGYEVQSEYFDKLDDCTCSKTLTLRKGYDYIITGEAVKKTVIIDKYGLITAYRVTKDDLREIAKARFIKPEYEPVKVDGTIVLYNANDEPIDTAKYVVSLIRINIPLITSSKERLYFGPYDMGMDCDIIENDILTLNFGAVEVHGVYGNAIDYEHTDISLYLPYIGFVTLNTSDCMNKTISLSYQVNVLNGEALAIISADNQVIETHSCDIAIKIPYQLSGGDNVRSDIEPNTNYLHNTNPFIYVRTHIATQPERMPYHDTNIYAVLGDLSGYTEATEIAFKVLSDYITTTEIDEIKSLIAGGIVI